MQLKKLEMIGFKSFANKTEVLFEPGVTCIVGPNGCGKSNVVDAIKWVLGTLSYKSVRGEEMLDVIFKGAEGVGPAGYAEVSLTLDNSDHTLPLAFDEVTITRRLHRDGVGEYLINRSACRLKDIRDLLYGTGIGTDNYSIIEQGKIDRLVTSEPKQRRLVFDEAAGISKYRARKKETELRLEKVTQDLLRIGDMTKEVQRQLRSVRSQASRASAYKRLQDEYREKRTRLVHRDFRKLTETLAATDARLAAIAEEKAARDADLAAARTLAAGIDAELASLDDRHAAIRQELTAAESKREFLDRTITALKARQEELNRDRAAAETQRDEAIRRLQSVRDLAAQAEQERAGLETEASALEARIVELRSRMEDAVRECRRIDQQIEAKKAERIELAARETEYRNQRVQADRDRQGCLARAERVAVRVADLDASLTKLRSEMEAAAGMRAALESEIADLKRRADLEEASLEQIKSELMRLDEELVALRAAKDMRTSRQATLRELEMSYEGLGEGTRALLKAGLPGVRGTLADLVEVNIGDVPALEAVLGDLAGMVVVETREQAEAAIEFARVHGRATVIAMDDASRRPEAEFEEALDGVPRGDSLVATADERVRGLLKAVLGDFIVVDGPKEARELLANWPVRATVVTRGGEIIDPRGGVTAGPRGGGPGLISRRSELKKLESEIEQFLNLISQRDTRRSEALVQVQEGEMRLKGIRQSSYEKRVEHGDLVRTIEQSEQKIKVGKAELDAARAEAQQLDLQQLQYVEAVARVDGLIAGLDGLRTQLDAEATSLADTQKGYETSRGQLQEELTKLQVERGGFDEKRRGIEARIDMARRDQAEQEDTVRGAEARLADFEARRGSVDQELARHVADREGLDRDVDERRKSAEAIDTERQAVVGRSEESRRKISGLESEASGAQVESSQLAVQQAQQQMSVQQIVEKSRDELGVDLTAAAPAAEEGIDWETLTRESEDLRSRISNFGAVNVVALEELSQLEVREKEIITQHEDLERAKGQLEELIRRINRESKELFERTLEFVREQFSTIFRKVFGGGKADIILQAEEGVEPLDQGLEVVVRMPQRESLPISMLSGGQKSLTAFSLVMALFKANPSPFCILDEADAALDEKNVDKYSGIITEYVDETQFIVISHNKRTMAVADVLYGVTMETPGVSKKVSVDLHGNNLDVLREKRETLKTKRAEVAARKAAAMTEVKEAANKALEAEKATEAAVAEMATATAVAEAPSAPDTGDGKPETGDGAPVEPTA